MPTTTNDASEVVSCYRCGEDIPLTDARPYWLRDKRSHGEWELREYCESCTQHLEPPDAFPELDF